jgi:hypothetical protein
MTGLVAETENLQIRSRSDEKYIVAFRKRNILTMS